MSIPDAREQIPVPVTEPTSISAIVLAYGDEPYLGECIDSLLACQPRPQIVLVDNGAVQSVDRVLAGLADESLVTLVRPGSNTGFAGGCHAGAKAAHGETLVFVNSDLRVAPDAPGRLAAALAQPGVGLATGRVLLAQDPDTINAAGNPVQFLMFSWAGGYGDPASAHDSPAEVASVSGATFAVSRRVWDELGGFDRLHFAYGEDLDLSLRAWQAGYRVVYVPGARSWHWYEFSRNPRKLYLLERNRLLNLATLYQRRTRRLIAPAAVVVEAGVFAVAVRDGWWREKARGWQWLWQHRDDVVRRRQRVDAARRVPDRDLARVLRGPVDPPAGFGFAIPGVVNKALDRYWRAVQRRL